MGPNRQKLSGACYRKVAKEKEKKKNQIIKQTNKIDVMFKSKQLNALTITYNYFYFENFI